MNPLETPLIIGGHQITTEYNTGMVVDHNNDGAWRPRLDQISVYPNEPDIQKTQVWLHEVLHAVNDIWCDSSVEHRDIEAMSQALLQILPQIEAKVEWN